MKAIINKLVILLLAVLAGVACTQHTEYDDTGFTAVETLLYPSTGDAVALIDQAAATTYFEWSVSKVGTPVYTVVFLNADKHEVGRYLADNNGQKAAFSILHSQLNTVAAEAGIAPNESGDIYWTVCAGLGGAELMSTDEPHKLTLTRYASVAAPYHLYVTGEGSEFGADAAQAKQLRELGNDQFEIYTKFTGSFSFVNRNEAGSKRVFGVSDAGGITEGSDATGTADGVYHVLVDFKRGTVAMEKIESVKYQWCWTPDPNAVMTYSGNGTWRIKTTIPSGDSRYRFDVVKEGVNYIWGYSSKNMADADLPSGITGSQYNISIRPTEAIPQFDYGFKFIGALKGIECTLVVDMSPEADNYYQWFDFDFVPEATAVTLLAPADNAAVELNAVAGSKLNFSWNKVSTGTSADNLTAYTVIFYSDAAQKRELSRKDARYDGSLDVTHLDLESVANAAGVASEQTGDIYWAVESKLLTSIAVSAARKLSVTRMKGIPENAYITGSASEFGSNYQALKVLGAGKFEIFTKIKSGSYNFTDGNTASARRFIVTDGAITESTGSISATEEAVYYILLDFGSGTATYKKIENMRLVTPNNKEKPALQNVVPYQGNGIWFAGQTVPYLADWDEDRYFYWAEVDGVKTKFGANPGMGGDLNDKPAENDPRFRVFWPIANVDNDDAGAYKFIHSYRGNTTRRVNIKLNMSPATENYYNYIEYLD